MMHTDRLDEKDPGIAMVTGGSRGIGLAICRQLQQDGYALSILGTTAEEQLADTLSSLRAGGQVLYCQGSLASAPDRQRYLEMTRAACVRIGLLVNNAGVAPLSRADVLDMREDSYDRVMDINLKGPVFLSQLVARHMVSQPAGPDGRRGTIITISSVSAETVSLNRAEYCLSKAGLAMLTQILAARLAQEGIMVFEIRPGIIKTDMTARVQQHYDKLLQEGVFPMQRWGQPEDVAGAVSLLASGKLSYATGECLHVDGGFHIRRL